MAETFGTRPSTVLGIDDPELAFYVDDALFVKLRVTQRDARERQRQGGQEPGIRRFGPPDGAADLPVVEA